MLHVVLPTGQSTRLVQPHTQSVLPEVHVVFVPECTHAWPLLLFMQLLPHAPQVAVADRSVSHPFDSLLLSQSAKPAAQVPLLTPPEQVTVAMWELLQLLLQPPQ